MTRHPTVGYDRSVSRGRWAGARVSVVVILITLVTAGSSRGLEQENIFPNSPTRAEEAIAELRRPLLITERYRVLVPAARLWMTDPEPHLTAIRLIREERDVQAVTPLLELLADGSFPYQAEVASALAELPDARAMAGLFAALSAPSSDVRRESALAVSVILKRKDRIDAVTQAALVERLMTLLKEDPSPLVRYAAYRALVSTDDWNTFLWAHLFAGEDPHMLLRCAYLNDTSIFAGLSDQDSARRDGAVVFRKALAEPQSRRLRFALARSFYLSGNPCGVPRVEAVRALGRMRQDDDVATLLALGSDPDAEVRGAAVQALAEQQGDAAMRAVLAALSDSVPAIRANAIALLADLPAEQTDGVLVRLAREGTLFERVHATIALGKNPGQSAALVERLGDESAQVRRAAKEGLVTQQEQDSIPILIQALSAPSQRLRLGAMRVLARYNGAESRRQLAEVLRSAARPSAPLAAMALGLRGEPEAREVLETALNQPGFPDQIALIHALQDLQQVASLPTLAAFVRGAKDGEAKAAAESARAVIVGGTVHDDRVGRDPVL